MRLLDLVRRPVTPAPWDEGDNIPWNDPDFSKRMLKEHLSQAHDAASRRIEKIEEQVNWIHHKVLLGRPTQILELGCGPGLYTSRLARRGHTCVGIDYSPASIAYAADCAGQENLHCTYLHQDIRQAEYGAGFGLAMLIYGELNVFRPADARNILDKANHALASEGLLLLEPHTFETVRKIGEQPPIWYSAESGLFSDGPHLCLKENSWDPASSTATIRYFIVDASTGEVTRHAQSLQAYTDAQYRSLLTDCGFDDVEFFPSLMGVKDATQNGLMAIVARKRDKTTEQIQWNSSGRTKASAADFTRRTDNMAKTQKRWVYSPYQSSKPQVIAALKLDLETKANAQIESVLKPIHIKPPRNDQRFNYIVDIYAKWRGSTFYFYSKYAVPGPNAILPFFEDKFARMEYVGSDRFNLSYMRYTGKWLEVYTGLSVDECLAAIKDDPLFQP